MGDDWESEVKQQRNWVGKDGEEWKICRGWQHSEQVVGDVVDFGLTDGEKWFTAQLLEFKTQMDESES